MPARKPLAERFEAFTIPEPNSGCLLWLGCLSHDGYARIGSGVGKEMAYAHRVAYEQNVGPIPPGLEPDHTCRVRCCVSFRHLELVTHQENLARGLGPHPGARAIAAKQRAKTHCVHGHEFTEANTYIRKGGIRQCKACARARQRD